MSEWLVSLEGTEAGHQLALVLALSAAFLHAVFGALQKGRFDPWLSRASIDACLVVISLPVALFLVPWPEGNAWWLMAGAVVIHLIYKVLIAMAYTRGAYTVVYPVMRGTGPLFTVIGAYLIFGEVFTIVQWLGVFTLVAGIFGLAAYNFFRLDSSRDTLIPALWFAVCTGLFVAIYTTYDAYAIRALPDPFTFIAWFFLLTSIDFPLLMLWRYRKGDWPDVRGLMGRSVMGAFIAYGSFGAVMLATRLDKVGEAAVLRETSAVFAAFIGWIFLKETVGPRRIGLMALIALGAVIVEMGG